MERAAVLLPWIAPHFGAISSDLSVFHRIDDPDDIGMVRFVALLEHLVHYRGAYAYSLAAMKQGQPAPEPETAGDGEMTDAELDARFRAVLAEVYPREYAEGVEIVSADKMVRDIGG